jgi:UDP-2,3-diacylglucosamine hydrolase
VFVGDVHLDRDDPDLGAFVAYLEGLGRTASRVVLMGDLFNLWIGDAGLEQEHHRTIVRCLRDLRKDGVEVHYLEGNRDYRIARAHAGGAFDTVHAEGLREDWGGRRIWASHGDLVNRHDVQYRSWRRLSRSAPMGWLLSMVPERRRFALAESLERRMRGTNLSMKRAFPEALVREFAAPFLADGADAVVLGHFHAEHELSAGPGGTQRIFVLPEWKGTRRHLRVSAAGGMAFEGA